MRVTAVKVGDKLEFVSTKASCYEKIYPVEILEIRPSNEYGSVKIKFLTVEKPDQWVEANRLRSKARSLKREKEETCATTEEKLQKEKRRCNLCGRTFKARNRFMRFCDVCKGRSEVYRFAQ